MIFKINDLFYTIQGEGLNAGRAALFIRMPTCNLSCPWCDTDFESHTDFTYAELAAVLNHCQARFAVVTGGEPSFNKQVPHLVEMLKVAGYEVAMESNGQFVAPVAVDHLTISPKRWSAKVGLPQRKPAFWFDTTNRPSEIKLVVDHPDVLLEATKIWNLYKTGGFKFKGVYQTNFYLSPEWNQRDEMIPRIVQYVQENPQWKINLQTHKFLGVK